MIRISEGEKDTEFPILDLELQQGGSAVTRRLFARIAHSTAHGLGASMVILNIIRMFTGGERERSILRKVYHIICIMGRCISRLPKAK